MPALLGPVHRVGWGVGLRHGDVVAHMNTRVGLCGGIVCVSACGWCTGRGVCTAVN